jgi:hypothetical protein
MPKAPNELDTVRVPGAWERPIVQHVKATEPTRLAPIASPSPGVTSNAPGYLYEAASHMLPRFTLKHDKNAGRWVLKNKAGATVKPSPTRHRPPLQESLHTPSRAAADRGVRRVRHG